jgi:hypothetical protein
LKNAKVSPSPPREGIIYGTITHWLLVVGMAVTVIGMVIYIASPGYSDKAVLLSHLWQGCNCQTIWMAASGSSQPPAWYSSLGMLSHGDMVATLGIAIASLAAVFGMWGAAFQLVRSKGRFYIVFAFIIAVVLTLSALGIVKLEA